MFERVSAWISAISFAILRVRLEDMTMFYVAIAAASINGMIEDRSIKEARYRLERTDDCQPHSRLEQANESSPLASTGSQGAAVNSTQKPQEQNSRCSVPSKGDSLG